MSKGQIWSSLIDLLELAGIMSIKEPMRRWLIRWGSSRGPTQTIDAIDIIQAEKIANLNRIYKDDKGNLMDIYSSEEIPIQ